MSVAISSQEVAQLSAGSVLAESLRTPLSGPDDDTELMLSAGVGRVGSLYGSGMWSLMLAELGRVPSDPWLGRTATPGPAPCYSTITSHILVARAGRGSGGVPRDHWCVTALDRIDRRKSLFDRDSSL